MEKTIAEILPYAVAVALSPMPIAALILMLLSNRARVNSVMFLTGWLAGLFILVFAVSSIISIQTQTDGSGFPTRKIIQGILGLVLVVFAVKQWRLRPHGGQEAKMPGWMAAVETFSPVKAFGVGLLLATVNLKNTPTGIATASVLSQAVTFPDQLAGTVTYLVIGGSTILVPTIGFLLLGRKLEPKLMSLKGWLIQNNAVIMFVVFLVLGLELIRKVFFG